MEDVVILNIEDVIIDVVICIEGEKVYPWNMFPCYKTWTNLYYFILNSAYSILKDW